MKTIKPPTESPPVSNTSSTVTTGEEVKDSNLKYNLSKFDYDLYKEEDDIALTVIRVKHINLPNKGDRWKIFENNTVSFIVEGTKLNNKEKEFLRTVDGVNFLIRQYKQGIKSFSALKSEIKKVIK